MTDEILQRIWQALDEATTQGTGFTVGFLGTLGNQGGPRIRAVILRRFERSPARIFFATHARAAKVAEIRQNPQVALTLHDNDRSVQLRIEGTASAVHDDAERQRAWKALADHSLYASTLVPGEIWSGSDGSHDLAAAFCRFAWIRIELERLDWLDLAVDPHQRWQFWRDADSWRGQRIVP